MNTNQELRTATDLVRIIGYVRCSTQEQADSKLGLNAQVAQIQSECEKRNWHLQEIVRDEGQSAKTMAREGIQKALRDLAAGRADVLMVSKGDRATRSVTDLYALMDESSKHGWALCDLEMQVDTSDPSGRMIAGMRGVVAQWEREIIGKRTKDALAAKKAQGFKLGAPVRLNPSVERYVLDLKALGWSVARIAARLTSESVPTPNGGRWHATGVQRIIHRAREEGRLRAEQTLGKTDDKGRAQIAESPRRNRKIQ